MKSILPMYIDTNKSVTLIIEFQQLQQFYGKTCT